MPGGGLFQMAAVGHQNIAMNLQNYNAVEEYIQVDIRDPIGFNKIINFDIPRNADTVKQILFNIKMNPAPRGWHYKKSWYTHFFKKITLEIGGQTIFSINSEMLQMEQLMYGETGAKEITFNYPTLAEQIEKSKVSHEVIVEPLKLSKLIHTGIIRMVSLAFHLVRVRIETYSLHDILEQDGTQVFVPIEEPHDTFIQSMHPALLYQYLEDEPRRTMATGDHKDTVIQDCYVVQQTDTNQRINIRFNQGGICSALYIWITDEHNKEISQQLVSHIKIKLNGNDRINSSGLHSRFINKNNLPFPTIDNDKSQNLYYISYFSGINPQNGAENGLNTSRIDNYTCEIDWINNINMNVKIHFVHRSMNTLRTTHGMAGLICLNNVDYTINEGIEFENTDQLIDIPSDELCMLTHDNFAEGTEVDYCNGCKKAFTTEMLKQWMATRRDKKCVHCAKPYNNTTFKRGKAHLVNPVNEDVAVIPANTAPTDLIVTYRSPNIISKFLKYFFNYTVYTKIKNN